MNRCPQPTHPRLPFPRANPIVSKRRPAVPPPLGSRPPEPATAAHAEDDLVDLGLDFVEETPGAPPAGPVASSAPVEPPANKFVSAAPIVEESSPEVVKVPSHNVDSVVAETAMPVDAIPVELPPATVESEPASIPTEAPAAAITAEVPAPILVYPAQPDLPTIQLDAPINFGRAADNTRADAGVESRQVGIADEAVPNAEEALVTHWTPPAEASLQFADGIELPAESSPPPVAFELPPATPALASPVFDLGFKFETEGPTTFLPDLDANFATTHSADANPSPEIAEETHESASEPPAEMQIEPAIQEPMPGLTASPIPAEPEAFSVESEIPASAPDTLAESAPVPADENPQSQFEPISMEPAWPRNLRSQLLHSPSN